ncbi:MAG: ABC transporter substrate-binding protein, partial [Actinobacteria bacterium]|nr:ABC transporter substrate-binding protein [Actinomycetota bacterium]
MDMQWLRIREAGRVAVVLAVCLVAAAIGGTARAQGTGGADEKLVLRVGTMSDLNTPNPFKACCNADYEFLFLNYDMLLSFGQDDLRAAPGLAEECTPSSDYMTWTCRIRSGATWQDGVPLTSRDVAFTYEFILNNGSAGALYKNYLPYEPTFETPDDETLIWKSTRPTFAPIVPPWVYILPEHVWGQHDGEDPKAIKTVPNVPTVGSGPFQLVEWEPGQFFRMEANKDYWGGAPAIDEIVFKVFANQETMVQELKSGDIDVADDLNATLFKSLDGESEIETLQTVSDWWPSLAFNFGGQGPDATNLPALKDVRVRQAVAHAIDKERIVDSVYQGLAAAGDTIVRPASAYWHLDISEAEEYVFNPEGSRRILGEAGYVDTDGDGVREDPKTGEPLELEIPVVTSTLGAVDIGKLIEPWLEDVGFAVTLKPMSESRVLQVWGTGEFDAYIWYWSGDPDPDFIMSVYTAGQCLGWSDGCYSDPKFDEMYEQQR